MTERDENASNGDDVPPNRRNLLPACLWLGAVAAGVIYLAFGRVTTYRAGGVHGSGRVWDLWRALPDALAAPRVVVLFLLLVVIAGGVWALWLLLASIGATAGGRAIPPGWALVALFPLGLIFVALLQWEAPRDDIAAGVLISRSGLEQTVIPSACATFLSEAAELRSGDAAAAKDERIAGSLCQSAIATISPTTWPTMWSTVEAAGR